MTNRKNTRRALVLSLLSLLLCCSMLVGTTFAWFTDSVTSNRNTIVAGNLDVVLEYWDGSEYTEVDGDTKLFNDAALWEPGYTEVAYLKVSNAGSLALKYQLAVNVYNEILGKTKTNEDIKLSDYLQFKVVESDTDLAGTYGSREAAQAAPATATKLQTYNSEVKPLDPKNEAGDNNYYDYVALIIYMPTTVGNEANHDGVNVPKIEMGVNLFATQVEAELDSFGNDYDKDAGWNGIIPTAMPDSLVLEFADQARDGGKVIVKDDDAFVYLNNLVDYFKANETQNPYNHYYYNEKWTVELDADINLMNVPIDSVKMSFFGGGFDGKGHTISNVVVKNGQPALFDNFVFSVKNLTVENIVVNAPGVTRVAAVSNMGTLENVHVVNANVIGGKYVGGLVGQGSNFINCSIKDSVIVGTDKTVGSLVGYCSGDPGQASATGNVVENVTVTGTWNVGGMFGQAQNVTVDGNTVKNVTVTSTTALPADADANEVRTAEVAARSAFANTTIGTNTVENVTLENK